MSGSTTGLAERQCFDNALPAHSAVEAYNWICREQRDDLQDAAVSRALQPWGRRVMMEVKKQSSVRTESHVVLTMRGGEKRSSAEHNEDLRAALPRTM